MTILIVGNTADSKLVRELIEKGIEMEKLSKVIVLKPYDEVRMLIEPKQHFHIGSKGPRGKYGRVK